MSDMIMETAETRNSAPIITTDFLILYSLNTRIVKYIKHEFCIFYLCVLCTKILTTEYITRNTV